MNTGGTGILGRVIAGHPGTVVVITEVLPAQSEIDAGDRLGRALKLQGCGLDANGQCRRRRIAISVAQGESDVFDERASGNGRGIGVATIIHIDDDLATRTDVAIAQGTDRPLIGGRVVGATRRPAHRATESIGCAIDFNRIDASAIGADT